MSVPPVLSGPTAILDVNRRKARYGVAYLRSICAQAGVGLSETSPDEDVLAVDCSVDFREGPVRVQVKCTSQRKLGGKSLTWPLKPEWLHSWDDAKVPVYFVLVIVPPDPANWLTHRSTGTLHHTAGFWRRLVPGENQTSVKVPKAQRLEIQTLDTWHGDLLAAFTSGGGS